MMSIRQSRKSSMLILAVGLVFSTIATVGYFSFSKAEPGLSDSQSKILTSILPPEICNNAIDDDGDGLIDCADSDCRPSVTHSIVDCQATNADINLTVTNPNTPTSYRWSDMVEEARWQFNNNTNDGTANAHHQTSLTGTAAYDAVDKIEGSHAFNFNGSTFIRYGIDGGFLETAYSARTYSMWIKPANLTGVKILFEQGGSTDGMAARLNANVLTAAYRTAGVQRTTGTLTFPNDGAWHHVAVVFNSGTLTCYLDGVASTSATSAATSIPANANNDAIGARNSTDAFASSASNFYSGRMDDVRLFYSALPAQRIADLARNDGDRLNLAAGTYTVTVTSSTGCTATRAITMTIPCTEICNNSSDDDGDGMIDCIDTDCSKITLSALSVSACINHPLQDVATVSLNVAWTAPPANDSIVVSIYGKKRYIATGSAAGNQTISLNVPANGATNNTITAYWINSPSLCQRTTTYNAPAACSNDQINCNILYLCGNDKPYDGDAWDHGFIEYLDEVNGSNSVTPVLTKADASGYGTYDPMNPSTFVNVNFNNYNLVVISATTEGHIATGLVNFLKNSTASIINCNYLIINDLGMAAAEGSYQFQSNAYTNNTTLRQIYDYHTISPYYGMVLTKADVLAGGTGSLWANANNMTPNTNSIIFAYDKTDVLPGVNAGHGVRVYLGYHMNGIYVGPETGYVLPAPVETYLNPAKHLTLDGKYYFDQAILAAAAGCFWPENCTNGLDDDGDGLTDCADSDCYLVANSGGMDSDGDSIGNSCDKDDDNDGISDANECQTLISLDFLDGACRLNGTVITSNSALSKNDVLTFTNLATLADGTVVDGRITINHIGRGLNYNPSAAHFELTPYIPTSDDYLMFTLELYDAGSLNIIPFSGQMIFRDIDSQDGFNFTELLGIKQNHTASLGSNLQLVNYQNGGGPANHKIYGVNPATAGVTTNWVDEINDSPSNINHWVTAEYETVTQLEVSFGVSGTSGDGSNARDLYISSSFQILDVCDLDGDGIANQLDLDTDGDGCPDAIEGSANFTPAGLVASGMAGGNAGGGYTGSSSVPVIDNLGNTVATVPTSGALGIPIIAGNGQGVGDSQDGSTQSSDCAGTENCTNGVDDDGDGLIDSADPDCCTSLGNAVAVVRQTGVTNATNAIGAPNAAAAEIYEASDSLVLDLGAIIPVGGKYKLVWRRKASYANTATADVIIEEGQTASAFTQNPTMASTTERTAFIETIITANVPTRYLRLRIQTNTDDDVEIDAVQIVRCGIENCTNGLDDDGDGLVDCDDPDCNLVTNGEFDSGTTGWNLYVQSGNTATFSVNNASQLSGTNSAQVNITTTANGTDWHVQLVQENKSFIAGKTYEISFQARASASRTVRADMALAVSPFNSYGTQTFNLTTVKDTFTYLFTPNTSISNNANLIFNVGAATGTVWIDNVSFKEACDLPGDTDVYLEAECAEVGSNLSTVADVSASGGSFITYLGATNTTTPPATAAGYIRFDAAVNSAGKYKIFARTRASSINDDSWWVRVNGGPWVNYNNIPISAAWTWNQVWDSNNGNAPVLFDLNAGLNTIDFAHRENGAKLDKIFVTGTGAAPSGAGGSSANCPMKFLCDSRFYQTIKNGNDYWLYHIQTSPTVAHVPLANLTAAGALGEINGTSFNKNDGYIYTTSFTAPFRFYRIGGDYSVHYMGNISGLPLSAEINAADMGGDGFIYYRNTANSDIYRLDIQTLTASLVCDYPYWSSSSNNIGDISYNPANGKFYGTRDNSNALMALGLGACDTTQISMTRTINGALGAFFIAADGTGYGYANTTGRLYRINLTTGAVDSIGQSIPTAQTDGCSCEGLKFTKTVDPDTTGKGTTVAYTFTIYNNWYAPLTNVAFRDTLLQGLTWASEPYSLTGGITLGATSVNGSTRANFTITNLPLGTTSFRINATVPANYSGGSPHLNQAYLSNLPGVLAPLKKSDYPLTPAIDDPTPLVILGDEICTNGLDDDGDGLVDCDDPDCQLITNGEFNNGLNGWYVSLQPGASATGSVVNTSQLSGVNSAFVDINGITGTDWHIQLQQSGRSIVAGQSYTVSFQARAAANRNARVGLQRATAPYPTFWHQSFALTTTAQTYSYTFTADSTSTNNVNLLFNLGDNIADVWLDKVSFTRNCEVTETCGNGIDDDGDGSIDNNDPNCFACSNGLLSNPEFISDFFYWYTWGNTSIAQEANGNKYAHIEIDGGGVSRDYPVTSGSTYSLNFKARVADATDWAWGGFIFLDAASNPIGYHHNSRLTAANFTLYQMSAVAPPGAAFIRVAAWKDPGIGTAAFDGFCLTLSTENCANGLDDDGDGLVDCADPSCPCANTVAVGNLVFIDADNDKVFDAGEGVNGVTVQLFRGSDNPLVAAPVATTTTANGGKYLFDNLAPGVYIVFIPPVEFSAGRPLFNRVSVDGFDGDYGNDDENSENGLDNPNPAVNGLSSGNIWLAYNSEPVTTGTELGHDNTSDDANDPSDDNNTDLTIDFGFTSPTPCAMTISQAKATPCYKDGSGNYVTDIEVTAYWAGFIDGDTIRVSMNGVTDQFAPYNELGGIIGNGTQHFFLRGVPASGGTGTVNAQFTVRSGCMATKSVALPNCSCPAGQLAGTAWQDFNNNGAQDAHETAGVAGVTVRAYDCTGTLVGTATTNASGQYSFSGLTNGDKYRIEFSNVPAPFFPSEMGVSNGSNVQFVTAPACVVNFGVNNPDLYCQANPLVGVPCYVNGLASAPSVATHDAFVLFPFQASSIFNRNTNMLEQSISPIHASTIGQIGATWGVAYQRSTKTVFSSAVIKRHAGLGPLGTGGIYKINTANPASPLTANWIDVRTLGVDTGTDPRDGTPGNTLPTATDLPSYDINAYDAVGRKGIADIDFDEARNTLWFVNLFERTLVGINNVNPNVAPTSANVVEYPISLPAGYSCGTDGDLRPWGLKVHEGRVYIGIICTKQGTTWYDATGLRAYVVSFDPSTPAAGFRYEVDVNMSYDKMQYGIFRYNNWVPSVASLDTWVGYTTPIVSAIDFDLDGSMILGISDRLGLQVGYYNYAPDETFADQQLHAIAQSGDILRLCKVGNNYVLPGSDPACPLLGVVHGDGINGGEHYWADWGPHVDQSVMAYDGFNETAMGAIALHRGAGELISTQTDPNTYYSGGTMTYNNVTGGDVRAYTLYRGADNGGQGKATGLGDVELLCDVQPIEIGNYIWLDSDDDGIQDACEAPLDSVVVSLYKANGTLIGTSTTDAFGNYFFNETNVDTTGNLTDNFWTGLSPNAQYVLVVGRVNNNGVVFANGKLRVNGLDAVLTFANTGEGSNSDFNDSDGTILSGMNPAMNGFPGLVVTTPAKGSLHNFDFGFRPLCEAFSVFAGTDVTICNGTTATLTAVGYGGLPPYTFAWSNGLGAGASKTVNPSSTVTYGVTITDADGCASVDQVVVTVNNCTEICADGIDNDGDGLLDCADPDCAAVGQPSLVNDIYQTCPGVVFTEQPIFNDGNIQYPAYSIFTNASKGNVTINFQGVFTYTPFNSSCGVDSFRYQVCNLVTGCCDQATVVLNIGDNLPPTLQNLPADLTISCSDAIPAPPLVFGLDACPGIYVTFDETNNHSSAGSCQNYSIVRTWTAYDRCGNATTGKQTITVADEVEPEIFRLYTLDNGKRMVAGKTEKAKTTWTRVKFPISFVAPPAVFAQVVTANGSEPVVVRVRNIDEEGFFLRIQEQEQADGVHAIEEVAWIATEVGSTNDAAKLQVGLAAGVSSSVSTINYSSAYTAPPVLLGFPQTNNESDPISVRFPIQGNNSFQVWLEEEQSLDMENIHAAESFAWMAMNVGELRDVQHHQIGFAGKMLVTNAWQTVTLPHKFSKPVVMFGGQPSGNQPSTVRVRNVTPTSFQVRIEEWQYLDNIFPARTLSYYVMEGSIPAYVQNPCNPSNISLVPGINLFAVDDCDNQVTIDYSESSVLTVAGLVRSHVWVAADDCGNANTLIRNDTCDVAAVRVRALLGGGLIGVSNNDLMRDNLRQKEFVPTASQDTSYAPGDPIPDALIPAMLEVTGAEAVVDWVVVEIRGAATPDTVRASRYALILRNGDVVLPDGSDIITFDSTQAGNYFVSLKHRNHLGVMTESTKYLDALAIPMVDFTLLTEPTWGGNHAGKIMNGKRVLWPGDFTGDGRVIYQGPGNDVFKLFYDVMTHQDNIQSLANFIRQGYEPSDVNLDGNAIYQGPNNDRSLLLQHSILSHPMNSLILSNFIAKSALP